MLGAAAFGALLKGSLDAASNLEQAVGGTSAVFQENSAVVDAWAQDSVASVGLSERAYRELASVIGAQLSGAGLSLDEATNSTRDLVSIGADLAATFGGTTQEAVQALGATLRGEFDPAERFGLALTAVRVQAKAVELGLADSTGAVSSSAKAQATLALITEQTANAQGQFARESDTAAGAAQRARAEAENQAAAFGDQLLPAYGQVLGVASQLAQVFGALPGPLQTIAIGLGGFVALRGPVGGALSFISDGAGGMAARFREAGGGARGLSAAITPGALGATAAVAGLALITTELANQAAAAAEARANMNELATAFADGGARAASEGLIAQAQEDFPELLDVLDELDVGMREVVDTFIAGGPAASALKDQLLAVGDFDPAGARLLQTFIDTIQAIPGAASTLSAAEEDITGATEGANVSLDDQVASLDAIADAADAARDSLDSLSGIQKSLDEASIDLQASIDATNAALAENGPTVDISTEAGRNNVQALRAQASGIREYLVSLAASGASARTVAQAQDFLTSGLARTSRQAGNTRAETRQLIDTYAKVPRRVTSDLTANSADADADLDRVKSKLDNLDGRTATVTLNAQLGADVGGFLRGGGAIETAPFDGPVFGGATAPPAGAPTLAPVTEATVIEAHFHFGTVVGSPEAFAQQIAPEVGREIDRIMRRG